MRVLLLGDSHLARIRSDDLIRIAADVTNVAVGGAFASDLAGQLAGVDINGFDAAVVSVGTNDAAPWKQVELEGFARILAGALPALPLVYVAPPGVDESRLQREVDRTNAMVARWSDAGREVVERVGGSIIDTPAVLAPLGSTAFLDDGLHLTPAAYELLIPAIATTVG